MHFGFLCYVVAAVLHRPPPPPTKNTVEIIHSFFNFARVTPETIIVLVALLISKYGKVLLYSHREIDPVSRSVTVILFLRVSQVVIYLDAKGRPPILRWWVSGNSKEAPLVSLSRLKARDYRAATTAPRKDYARRMLPPERYRLPSRTY